MKRLFAILLTVAIICCSTFCTSVSASEVTQKTETTIEYLENGDCIKTYITYYETNSRATTKSGSKTKEYQNSSGETLWSVTVTGTFSYDGTTSSCTKVSHSAVAYSSGWSIKSSSSSKSGNTATADATATYKLLLISKDYSMTVSLSCSPQGVLS